MLCTIETSQSSLLQLEILAGDVLLAVLGRNHHSLLQKEQQGAPSHSAPLPAVYDVWMYCLSHLSSRCVCVSVLEV